MSIEYRTSEFNQMKKNIKIVKKITGKMGFDENMHKVNWKFVRFFSNIGYKFMPKEKGCKFKKILINNKKTLLVIPR